MVRLLVAGIAMVPAGILMISMGLGDEPVYPVGLYTGPALILFGVILAGLAGKNLFKNND